MTGCTDAWEALRGDPLPWLLDAERPNLHWRVLLELIRRPRESPAVARARGGSNAAQPVATLISDLHPDGTWSTGRPQWQRYAGSGWRLLAAVQFGADPEDPRLQAAAGVLLESAPGEGGFALRDGGGAVPWLTARALQGLAELGWCRHPRFQEALAWLEDGIGPHPIGGWPVTDRAAASDECAVTSVSLLRALDTCGDDRRKTLRERAIATLVRSLDTAPRAHARLGHPCLGRTDAAEILSSLARAKVPFEPRMTGALQRVQRLQIEGGRWRRDVPVPKSLDAPNDRRVGTPSRWVSLKCVVALMMYAVDAHLPRMYPQKPVTDDTLNS
jgi:hypothetical protein